MCGVSRDITCVLPGTACATSNHNGRSNTKKKGIRFHIYLFFAESRNGSESSALLRIRFMHNGLTLI